jgi:hypothetical protein
VELVEQIIVVEVEKEGPLNCSNQPGNFDGNCFETFEGVIGTFMASCRCCFQAIDLTIWKGN